MALSIPVQPAGALTFQSPEDERLASFLVPNLYLTNLTVWSLETTALPPAPREGNLDGERGKGEVQQTNHFLQFPPLTVEYLALEKLFNPTLGNWFCSGNMLLFISIAFSCFFPPSPSPAAAEETEDSQKIMAFRPPKLSNWGRRRRLNKTNSAGALHRASGSFTPGPPRPRLPDSTRAKWPAKLSQPFCSALTARCACYYLWGNSRKPRS